MASDSCPVCGEGYDHQMSTALMAEPREIYVHKHADAPWQTRKHCEVAQ